MAKKRRESTFKDLLKQPTWSELGKPRNVRRNDETTVVHVHGDVEWGSLF